MRTNEVQSINRGPYSSHCLKAFCLVIDGPTQFVALVSYVNRLDFSM